MNDSGVFIEETFGNAQWILQFQFQLAFAIQFCSKIRLQLIESDGFQCTDRKDRHGDIAEHLTGIRPNVIDDLLLVGLRSNLIDFIQNDQDFLSPLVNTNKKQTLGEGRTD